MLVKNNSVSWIAKDDFETSIVVYEQGLVIFHSGTGETHLLNGIMRTLFDFFLNQNSPQTLKETANWLGQQSGQSNIDDMILLENFNALVSMQLIEQINGE